ncbi:hypothetical protein BH10ACT3_BH10ACT3_00510 [soil metagenome]
MERRGFLVGGALVALTAYAAEAFQPAFAATAGPGPYGPLGAPDSNGLQLPAGFTSRIIGVTGAAVGSSSHLWHSAPDGGACFPAGAGGWVYVSNSEMPAATGGASAVKFLADGTIDSAYSILTGTTKNCAGGPTPWGTWLSCEENGGAGRVWECNPQAAGQGIRRAAMGVFNHEAVAIDPSTGYAYLTEDDPVGRLYRFVPTVPGDLSAGSLYAASVSGTTVSWIPTSATTADRQSTTTGFGGGEGMWAAGGSIYFTTKYDRKVWQLVPSTNTLTVLHDCATTPSDLNAVDNITTHPVTGDIYVAEDGGNMELCVLAQGGGVSQVTAFARITGQDSSEVTGPAFSPDGTRLYFSSQRGADGSTGVTYEVTGPFRTSTGGSTPVVDTYPVVDDTYVRGGTYATTPYGAVNLLAVCRNASDTYTRWSYFAVDIGSSTASVTSAILRLYAARSTGTAGPSEVLGVSDVGWSGSTMTWQTKPTPGSVVGTFTPSSTTSTWFDIDVTAWVAARRAAGATRVAFAVRQPAGNDSFITINSRENTRGKPELVVTSASTPPPANVGPTASFTTQVSALTVNANGAGSSDSDGAIAGHGWDFGDGTTATGATVSHTYAAAGTFTITLTVTDDDGATGQTIRPVTVAAPPPNSAPTASFTEQISSLSVAFNASTSADPDGTIATYLWDFGDGTTGTGVAPTRVYASAGTYPVALTVTDDKGAIASASHPVTVTTAPTPTVLATDNFGRTVTNGFGTADLGGAWTLSGSAANFAVNGGKGRMTLPSGGLSRAATLAAVQGGDVDASVDLTLDKPATGGGIQFGLVARKVGTSEYRLRVQAKPTSTTLILQRVVNGTESNVSTVNLNGVVIAAGTTVHMRLRVTGSSSVALAGKLWFGGAAEPTSWQIQGTDSTPALSGPGGVGVQAYISGTATNLPVVVVVDQLRAQVAGIV